MDDTDLECLKSCSDNSDSDDLEDHKSNIQMIETDTDTKMTVARKEEDFLAETRKEVMTGLDTEIGSEVAISLSAEIYSEVGF